MSGILDLLKPDGYIMANKTIIKLCGLHEAILLGSLCSRQSYWNEHWNVDKYGKFDGYFFCTIEELEDETTLSGYFQRNAFKNLEEKGFIKTSLRGVPAKKYFKVVESKLIDTFIKGIDCKNETDLNSSNEHGEELEVNRVNTNNNKENNNKNNNKNYSETKVSQKKKSKKESDSFIKYKAEVIEIISYLNDKLGTRYRPNSGAASKHIPSRLEEGFTVEDFKTIIDKKYDDWHGTEWEKFLRPNTLFAPSHFEDYLNQKTKYKKPSEKIKREVWDGTVIGDEVF